MSLANMEGWVHSAVPPLINARMLRNHLHQIDSQAPVRVSNELVQQTK